MSRRVVSYEGEGKRRRPVYADEGPAAASTSDGLASLGRLSALTSHDLDDGAGRRVERRDITQAEIEARRERDSVPDHLTRPTLATAGPGLIDDRERAQASRRRGAEANRARIAASKAPRTAASYRPEPKEEPAVTEPTQEPEDVPVSWLEPPMTTLIAVADAANEAALAWEEKIKGETRWLEASAALLAAWRALPPLPETVPLYRVHEPIAPDEPTEADRFIHEVSIQAQIDSETEEEVEAAVASAVEAAAVLYPSTELPAIGGGPAPRRNVREARTEGLTARQAKAIQLMQAGSNRADIARSMGTTYQTVDGLFEAAAKKGLLPIELIPLLPARFARYQGV